MTPELKDQIVSEANAYMLEHRLSSNQLSKSSGINASYLSLMLRNIYVTKVADKDVEIADNWFVKLATAIGKKLEKVEFGTFATPQFIEVTTRLMEAKKNQMNGMIIGVTGSGKTFGTDVFCNKQPLYTYRLTVSSLYSVNDIITELLEKMCLNSKGRGVERIKRIQAHLQKLRMSGLNPLIILDEAENLKVKHLRMLKALYDAIAGYAAVQLIGTPELLDKLERMKQQEVEGIAQFCRRFKAGIIHLTPIDRTFEMMLSKHVKDDGLRKLICSLCENYGEVNDYLLPVMREAYRLKKPFTEELFRLYHNMPNYNKVF